jgi:tetratricopeptide (TPR) repeat protein
MKVLASLTNELGGFCQRRGCLAAARRCYAAASFLAPRWSVAWFNRGLIAKFERRWPDSLAFNQRAAQLDPNDPPAWWNLGIAATVLGDWQTARRAWSSYGINVPEGDMNLGAVPIRVSPLSHPEVVWCDRLDPARAVIRNIPTPESGRGCGDTVLHDGEPKGSRMNAGHEVPVFDELQLLTLGRLHTFAVRIVAPLEADLSALESASSGEEILVEDWPGSIRWLCRKCSDGSPHEHCGVEPSAWEPQRLVGVAASSEEAARSLLNAWASQGVGREVNALECVLKRG